jgi:hypothetical protein
MTEKKLNTKTLSMRVSRNPDTNIRIKVTTTVNKAHKFIYFCGMKFRQEN